MKKMAALEDDFYGAECELDDHRLIDSEEENELEDTYEREFRENEQDYFRSNHNLTQEEFRILQEDTKSYFINGNDLQNDCLNMRLRFKKKDQEEPVYPPERKPPIFDFFTVFTAFIAAAILAYYTISSYWYLRIKIKPITGCVLICLFKNGNPISYIKLEKKK